MIILFMDLMRLKLTLWNMAIAINFFRKILFHGVNLA